MKNKLLKLILIFLVVPSINVLSLTYIPGKDVRFNKKEIKVAICQLYYELGYNDEVNLFLKNPDEVSKKILHILSNKTLDADIYLFPELSTSIKDTGKRDNFFNKLQKIANDKNAVIIAGSYIDEVATHQLKKKYNTCPIFFPDETKRKNYRKIKLSGPEMRIFGIDNGSYDANIVIKNNIIHTDQGSFAVFLGYEFPYKFDPDNLEKDKEGYYKIDKNTLKLTSDDDRTYEARLVENDIINTFISNPDGDFIQGFFVIGNLASLTRTYQLANVYVNIYDKLKHETPRKRKKLDFVALTNMASHVPDVYFEFGINGSHQHLNYTSLTKDNNVHYFYYTNSLNKKEYQLAYFNSTKKAGKRGSYLNEYYKDTIDNPIFHFISDNEEKSRHIYLLKKEGAFDMIKSSYYFPGGSGVFYHSSQKNNHIYDLLSHEYNNFTTSINESNKYYKQYDLANKINYTEKAYVSIEDKKECVMVFKYSSSYGISKVPIVYALTEVSNVQSVIKPEQRENNDSNDTGFGVNNMSSYEFVF